MKVTSKTRKALLSSALLGIFTFFNGVTDAAAQSCVAPPSGLVSWWPGDGNVNDIIDANPGTLQNEATFAAGKVGQAFRFDGVNDFVQVADSPALDITDGLTIDTWINLNAYNPGNQGIVSKLGGAFSNRSYSLLITGGTGFIFFLTTSSGSGGAAIQGPVIPLNQWVHVAAVKDSGSGSARIYINGVLAVSGSVQHPIASTITPVTIGAATPPGPNLDPFNGLIDEVEIYNRALSASEIQAIFDAGSAGKCKGTALIDVAITFITDLGLDPSTDATLVQKLQEAQDKIDLGDLPDARSKVCDFVGELEAAVDASSLATDDANQLLKMAGTILGEISFP